jgi:hypothetical protein
MINLFYDPGYWGGSSRMNGPRKLVDNLFNSLDHEKIPYSINVEKYKHNFIVHYDYRGYLKHSQLTLENCIIGPQIWFFDEHVNELKQHPDRYKSIIVPSEWVKTLAIEKFGFDKVDVWPVGIPIPKEEKNIRFDCLIYYKRRSAEDLSKVINFISSKGLTYNILSYGDYPEEDLHKLSNQAKFCFLLNGTESQGIAVNEIMSYNTPIIAWDLEYWNDQGEDYKVHASSVPYWSDICGEKFYDEDQMEETFERFYSNIDIYNPKKYVEENLSYKASVNKLLEILC